MYLRHKRNLFSSALVLVTFLITFGVLVEKLELHKLFGFDTGIIRVIQRRIDNPNTRLMKLFTFLGSPTVVSVFVVCSSALLYRSGRKRESWGMLIVNATGAGFNQILKYIFRRKRPHIHRLIRERGYSFPSGHSMGAVVFYGTLSHILCRHMRNTVCKMLTHVTSILMVLMTGISRIYLGVHYPSDVVSGYAAGGAWLTASMKVLNVVLTRR